MGPIEIYMVFFIFLCYFFDRFVLRKSFMVFSRKLRTYCLNQKTLIAIIAAAFFSDSKLVFIHLYGE
ncbi:hypothetical protein BG541_14840 [Listeria monocytogenes]|nr:hypothetical protein BG541_14840 [Listeria monocytogenes]